MLRFVIPRLTGAICFVLAMLAAAGSGAQQGSPAASAGDAFALELRDHVVKIRAHWASGEVQEGFGFVVGENDVGAYIVTANHVVRGDAPGEVAEDVQLTWYGRAGEQFPATLLGTSDARRDLAVLRSELPPGLVLRPELMVYPHGQLARRTPVWYVGRAGTWYVPSQAGTVNSIDLDEQITVDGLNLQVGTSGAPLVTDKGIAGMIVEDAGGVARATAISFIARAFETWAHPWEMMPAPEAVPPVPAAQPRLDEESSPPVTPGVEPPDREADVEPTEDPERPVPVAPDPEAWPDASSLQAALANFRPSALGSTIPPDAALELMDVEVQPVGAAELRVRGRAILAGLDLGPFGARVVPGDAPGLLNVELLLQGGFPRWEIDECAVALDRLEVELVWDAELESFVDGAIGASQSNVSCPDAILSTGDVAVDLAFAAEGLGAGSLGRGELSVSRLAIFACDDLPEYCVRGPTPDASSWRRVVELDEARLSLNLDDFNPWARSAAFSDHSTDYWPKYIAFLSPVIDPFLASIGDVPPEVVGRLMDGAATELTLDGFSVDLDGLVVTVASAAARATTGWPATLSYQLSEIRIDAPGAPAAIPSNLAVDVKAAGQLDVGSLIASDPAEAVSDAGPVYVAATLLNPLGRVEADSVVNLDRIDGAELLEAEATLSAPDPAEFLASTFIGPFTVLGWAGGDPGDLERALREVVRVASDGSPPGAPLELEFDLLTQGVTMNGHNLQRLAAVLEGCLREGC